MANLLNGRGPQAQGRIPRAGDPRARRNSQAASSAHLLDGEGLTRDGVGRLQLEFTGVSEQITLLNNRIETLEAALKAAGMVT